MSAAEYAEAHGLQPVLAAAVTKALQEKPANPLAAIGKSIMEKGKVVDYLMKLKYSVEEATKMLTATPSADVLLGMPRCSWNA